MLALFTEPGSAAMAVVQPSRASRRSERFISLASGHAGQWRKAGTHGAVDRAGNRATGTAAVSCAHAGHAIGIGDGIEAWQIAAGLDIVDGAERAAAGDTGEVAVAQFGAVHGGVDACGRIGIDGGRVGVFAAIATNRDRLDIAVEDDDAIAFCVDIETEQCAGC